jgi:hypothetical protein
LTKRDIGSKERTFMSAPIALLAPGKAQTFLRGLHGSHDTGRIATILSRSRVILRAHDLSFAPGRGLKGIIEGRDWDAMASRLTRIQEDPLGLARIEPVIAEAMLARDDRLASLMEILDPNILPTPAAVHESMNDFGGIKRIDIFEAAQRMTGVHRSLASTERVPIELGGLAHSTGSFNVLMHRIMAQGLHELWMGAGGQGPTPLILTVLSHRDMPDALRYTAGIHRKGIDIHGKKQDGPRLPLAFLPTAFPPAFCTALSGIFELHLMTLQARHMPTLFSADRLAVLARDALCVTAIKAFEGGLDPLKYFDGGRGRERRDLSVVDVSGYTGTKGMLAGAPRYPPMPFNLGRGLAIAVLAKDGKARLDQLQRYAAVLSAGIEPEEKKVGSAARVFHYVNTGLRIPVSVEVAANTRLQRLNKLWAIYKNVYSGIIGAAVFRHVLEQVLTRRGESVQTIAGEIVNGFYQDCLNKGRSEIMDLLRKVEGLEFSDSEILEVSIADALESWKAENLEKLVKVTRRLFLGCFDREGRFQRQVFDGRKEEIMTAFGQIWATRNPDGGQRVAASRALFKFFYQYGVIDSLNDLLDGTAVLEGYETMLHIGDRHDEAKIAKFSAWFQEYYAEALGWRNPSALPVPVRRRLRLLAEALGRRFAGMAMTQIQASALLGVPVDREYLDSPAAMSSKIGVDEVLASSSALREHLTYGIELIESRGESELTQPLLRHLRGMIDTMFLIERMIEAKRKRLAKGDESLRKLTRAFERFIAIGEEMYEAANLDQVIHHLSDHVKWVLAFLDGVVESPLPDLRRHLPEAFARNIDVVRESMAQKYPPPAT